MTVVDGFGLSAWNVGFAVLGLLFCAAKVIHSFVGEFL